MSASAIKMGGVFVEIGADPKKFFAALNRVNKSLANMGKSLVSGGAKLAAAGIGMSAPIVAAVRQGANFESVLLSIRASVGLTANDLERVKAAAIGMSQSLGVGPTAAAKGMLDLLKAGMPLEQVLGGAGKAALEFAKVGELDIAQAAVVMSDAMNVFGVSSARAVNVLSGAADSSSTSIAEIVEAFSNVGATGKDANQTIETLSAAMAILGNNMVKGGDAGTALKSMMLRLTSGADGAAEGLAAIGLSMDSFRDDATKQFLPLGQAMDVLRSRLDGLNAGDRSKVLYKIFGSYGLKAATILLNAGSDGFARMEAEIAKALPVGEKFKAMMSGMAGGGSQILAALERLSIVISDALAPAISKLVPFITGAIDGFAAFASTNKQVVTLFTQVTAAVLAGGGAMVGLGFALRAVGFGLGGIVKAGSLALSPLRGAAVVAKVLTQVSMGLAKTMLSLVGAVGGAAYSLLSFATGTGVAMARASAGFGTMAVNAVVSAARVSAAMTGTALVGVLRFVQLGLAGIAQYSAKSTAMLAVSAAQAGAMGAAQVATTVSVVSATVARAAEGNMRAAAIGVQALARLGVAGTTSALIAGAQVARLTAQGSTQLLRLGVTGSTALATIGTTAMSVGASTTGAMVRAGTTSGGALASIGRSAVVASSLTIKSLIKAAAVGIAQAGAMSLAWLGGLARITAASALSGVAMAASFLAPFAAIGLAIAGAGALIYTFKDDIFAAFSSVGDAVSSVAGYIGQGFSSAIADATVVFSDLYSIASTTFSGIYDAIAAGDLSGAMSIAWAGVQAVFLRGVEAILSAWYTAIGEIKKAFVSVGSAWNTNVTKPISMFGVRVAEAAKERAVLGAFDTWQGTVFDNESKKAARSRLKVADNLLSSSTVEGFAANRSAAETTMQSLQGVVDVGMGDGATDEQRKAGAAAAKEIEAFKSAIQMVQERFAQLGIKTAEERQAAIDQAKAEIDALTQDNLGGIDLGAAEAQQRLTDLTSAAAAKRSDVEAIAGVQDALQSVQSLSALGKIGEQISGIMDRDTLTAEQEQKAIDAYNAAQKRIVAETQPTGDAASKVTAAAGAAGKQSQQSMGSIAGTFSSLNLGAAFGGQSVGDRIARAAEETARNTRNMDGARFAA